MAAIIKCRDEQKEEIKKILVHELGKLMDEIQQDEDSVFVQITKDGLDVGYPMGQIYGHCFTYIQSIEMVFEDLKKIYPNLEIQGVVYYYETVSDLPNGFMFYCKSTDKKLKDKWERWQVCSQCGKAVGKAVVYNSSLWYNPDDSGSTPACLCSPTCMLEYAVDEFRDSELDADKEDLWNRIVKSLKAPKYLEDFAKNRERIEALIENEDLDVEKKAVLLQLLNNIQN